MKVGFLQFDFRDRTGIMALSASLKQNGHKTNAFTGFDSNLIDDIKEYNPDILGISSSTTEHKFLYKIAEEIKKWNEKVVIVLGGPHGTFFPEELENREFLDVVCRGEGDHAIVELADRLQNNEDYDDVLNLWIKKNDKIFKNEMRDLIENLDELLFPDRDLYYDKYPMLRDLPTKHFILGRGCPFKCTYCFNHLLRNYCKGKGKYVRMPSVDYCIRQIKEVQDKYGLKWVQINDDTFNYDKTWLYEFLDRFKREINVEFIANLRVDLVDEEMILKLKDAGLDRANFGIEHGNEKLRNEVLHRYYTNEQIIKVANWLKENNIRYFTANMIGFPNETLDMALETIKINRIIKPELATCSILVPFPKTDIYNYCVENNFLKENITIDDLPGLHDHYWASEDSLKSVVKLEDENQLLNLCKYFDLMVNFESLEPMIMALMKLKPNKFSAFVSQIPEISTKVYYSESKEEKLLHIRNFLNIIDLKLEHDEIFLEIFKKKLTENEDLINVFMMILYLIYQNK